MSTKKKARPNTATWVDERDGKRLARQTVNALRVEDEESRDELELFRLAQIRGSVNYLREEAGVRIGPGFRVGVRVWHLDATQRQDIDVGTADEPAAFLGATLEAFDTSAEFREGVTIFTADYDARGDLVERSLHTPAIVAITRHALARLFERLRTNALDDVVRKALVPLSRLDRPETLANECRVEVAGVGEFYMACETVTSIDGSSATCWIAKTFVAAPK